MAQQWYLWTARLPAESFCWQTGAVPRKCGTNGLIVMLLVPQPAVEKNKVLTYKQLKWNQGVTKSLVSTGATVCAFPAGCFDRYVLVFHTFHASSLSLPGSLSTNQHSTDTQHHPQRTPCSWDFRGSIFVMVGNVSPKWIPLQTDTITAK